MVDRVIPDRASDSSHGSVSRRWVEVRTGEFAPEVQALTIASTVKNLWSSSTLVAAASSVVSGWVDISSLDKLLVMKSSAGGVYVFEVDWSRDGVAVDIVEIVTVAEDTSIVKSAASMFARFRVKNTDAVVAFTQHLTVVNGR